MSTFLITGGTGIVGKALTQMLLSKGHRVIILSRNNKNIQTKSGVTYAKWDVKNQTIDEAAIADTDYIFHLTGASVFAKRWTKKYKKEIEESRTLASQLLINSLTKINHTVKAIVSASAIGWYGADKMEGKAFTEDDPAADDFLGLVCKNWEAEIEKAGQLNIPIVKLRIGMVLSNEGGFLTPIQKALKWAIAVIPGNGNQIISWIHIEDLCRLFLFAAENENIQGSINAVATMPVKLKTLATKEAALLNKKRFIILYIPGFLLRILLGSKSSETTKSCTVSNSLIKSKGFQFKYAGIDAALEALATNRNS
ncbi:MAG TPA: TIGR01777 family oxidoreductase [Ferruginibacter sp.]|nr:TIGR01777 family oxidoreductase [Ferruginibacter sp.]